MTTTPFPPLRATSLNHWSLASNSKIEMIIVTGICSSICLDLDLDLVDDVHVDFVSTL